MKQKVSHKTLALMLGATLLLSLGCDKNYQMGSGTPNATSTPQLNAQEQALVGKWRLNRSETYEITGVDSAGQLTGSLIGNSSCDSICTIEFKSKYWSYPYCPEYEGAGSIGGCDSTNFFVWTAKQNGKLEIGSGTFYDIVYLLPDSTALSIFQVQDVLKLKSVFYYKRN